MEVKTAPAMDVVPSPTESGPVSANPDPEPKPVVHHPSHPPAKPAAPPKAPRDSSLTAAIIGTVIIVLGLAAMAVFAYLKQTGKL